MSAMTHEALIEWIDTSLDALLHLEKDRYASGRIPADLAKAMRYSLLAGGKRIRPLLLLRTVDMLGGDLQEAMPLACALEMIHTYSLIHDDLPGMDDDDLRRGRPTNHKVFGEGMAILAGDGLLNFAHEVMLQNAMRHPDHLAHHVAAIEEISRRAGVTGMIGGQCLDVLSEGKPSEGPSNDEALLCYIHQHKTADLLVAPLVAGAWLCGADPAQRLALAQFGCCIGLAFQIVDDLLDVEGDEIVMGKATGADARKDKLTWISLFGIEASRQKVEHLRDEARLSLEGFGASAHQLLAIADRLTVRKA